MVTFTVDDVTPAAQRLPQRPLGELFPDALVVGGDPALPVLAPDGVHPLLSAVARAFAEHRPLVLSPDAVWLTIAQGVAQHVRLHAEELRALLVRHAGRKRLAVEVPAVPVDTAGWAGTTEMFAKLLAGEVDDTDLFECDFSTSTDTDRMAGRVVLLDVYSPYFAFWLVAVCGIPSVTVTGTVEDWRRIRGRVDALDRFGLQHWRRSLAPIADEFVAAAAGTPDRAFWQRIYNPVDAYGGDVITGWITRFYPYLAGTTVDRPNEMLDLPLGEPRGVTPDHGGFYSGPGILSTSVPATLSRVIINVNDRGAGDYRVVALEGGLVAVAQDPDGALRPVAGWHVVPAAVQIDDVIDRIVAEHEVTAPPAEFGPEGSADVVALYSRIGAATLFGGRWRLVPDNERRQFRVGGTHVGSALVELDDGRSIASVLDEAAQTEHWMLCRVADADSSMSYRRGDLAGDPADVPMLGTSLAMLLQSALDAGGDVEHLETGRLDRFLAG